MTNFKALTILGLVAACFIAMPANAQVTTLTQTTLSSAQLSTDRTVCLASATGVVIPSVSAVGSTIFIVGTGAGYGTSANPTGSESEVVQGTSTLGPTCYNVIRQINPTLHASGLTVYLGPRQQFATIDPRVGIGGTCTLSTLPFYPYINLSSGAVYRCIASQWVVGQGQTTTATPFTAFSTLSTPGNLIAPTSVTSVAGTEWFSQMYIDTNATLTGACWLNGATVSSGNTIAFLADASGAIIANTALAGTADAGASQYQCAAFVATTAVYGPGTYFVGIQKSGTTDNFLAYATGGAPTNYGTGSLTGTFGTLTALTPTVTFTTAKGPMIIVY